MMKLTAIYRMDRKGNVKHMTRDDYTTKTSLYKDLKSNGFRVLAILTETQVNEIKDKSYRECHENYEEYVHEVL